jgi:hypothetical protein
MALQACHLVYNKLEPQKIVWHTLLLIVIPLSSSLLLLPHIPNVFTAVLWSWSVYIGTLLTSTVLYRLSPFHPLAKYPGPLICRITKIWFAMKSWSGKQHLYYYDLHQQYGDIVRIGERYSWSYPSLSA